MSVLSLQCDELRRLAGIARGYAEVDARENGRALLFESAEAMREAADTIESLRDRLQELQGVGGESRYSELFGTPERAARTLSPDDMSCKWCLLHDHCKDECLIEEHSRILEWLRGDAE